MYRVLVTGGEGQVWQELGGGPWAEPRAALGAAEGAGHGAWIVVNGGNHPLAFGDRKGVGWSWLDRSHRGGQAARGKRFFIEVQYNNAREPDRFDWADCREGPFDSAQEAIA